MQLNPCFLSYLRGMSLYPLVRELLFRFPPENVHYFSMNLLQGACRVNVLKGMIEKHFRVSDARLKRELFGLAFPNPVGLGAGFDKNAFYLEEQESLGFWFS